jgi:hypothetical protein
MTAKTDYTSLYQLIQGYQDSLEGRRGEFQDQRTGLSNFRNMLNDVRLQDRPDAQSARELFGLGTDAFTKAEDRLGSYQSQLDRGGEALGGFGTQLSGATSALDLAQGDTEKQRDFYSGMMDDESKRGYDQATVDKMYGKLSDVATGGARTLQQSLGKQAAAQGMGSTGAVMRNMMTANEGLSGQLLGAQRDVDLANATAKREDLWNAAQGLGATTGQEQATASGRLNVGSGYGALAAGRSSLGAGYGDVAKGFTDIQAGRNATAAGYGGLQSLTDQANQSNLELQSRTYDQNQNALAGETQLQGLRSSLYEPMAATLSGKNKPGFWGTLGNSFAGALGSGLGSMVSG